MRMLLKKYEFKESIFQKVKQFFVVFGINSITKAEEIFAFEMNHKRSITEIKRSQPLIGFYNRND